MKIKLLIAIALSWTSFLMSQTIEKPVGCFAGTNGTHPSVLAHSEARGVNIMESWSSIETSPGVFDFTVLDNKIASVTNEGLKYAIGVPAGALGSPDWLIDLLGADFFSFSYRGSLQRLPKWWDTVVEDRLDTLINRLGDRYGGDPLLSHVYVSQMSTNGVEGHLNGVNMSDFSIAGYDDVEWINRAIYTTELFLQAFPDKPIVFEVHEINHDTLVPATIINHFYEDSSYCNRVGLGMWWISGKTSYQSDLLDYIQGFEGDSYAQIIGRSDELERFQDSSYASVFTQAKSLGVRYIEPWPYEFQHATHDSLMVDFNQWADINFSSISTCSVILPAESIELYGELVEDLIELEWATAIETNNIGFEIQKSMNGLDWQVIDFVDGQGSTNEYEYLDINLFLGTNYYRLKQIDSSGFYSYSNMIAIEYVPLAEGVFIFPNPSNGLFEINLGQPYDQFTVSVFQYSGSKILEMQNSTTVDLSKFPQGLYFVVIDTGEGRETMKIIKY